MSTLTKIDERNRMKFLPTHYGRAMMGLEGRVYTYARRALDYSGGFWDFAETDNGAGVMLPPVAGETYTWKATEYWGGTSKALSREAVGLALTTLAVNHELWKVHELPGMEQTAEQLNDEWQRLMETVSNHPEADELLGILD